MLSIDIVGLTGACSYALDCIEAELVNIKNKHGKRVAYISIRMAEYWKIQGEALQDLAMCALLHDNALTQYISEELKKDSVIDLKKDLSEEKTNLHCIYGEKNITKLPFKTDVSNVICIIMNMPMELALFKKSGMKFHCSQGLFILQISLIL